MRETNPRKTSEIEKHCKGKKVWQAHAFEVSTFRMLVEHVARLAYANPDELLFFRGQEKDFQSKAGGSTLYPAIYRGDQISSRELIHRFKILDQAARLLVDRFKRQSIEGHGELRHKRYIQWSILQHYEVVDTPLLDLTQSLRVACSFAQLRSTDPTCYVYVLGLPYITNRISINSEHDLVNIRLLSICPPSALRPYFQEGFLAGTTDVTTDFESKTELDFRNRLIAKFAIRRSRDFWGPGFEQIPETALYPKGDKVLELCNEIKRELREELLPGELGEFVSHWSELEQNLLIKARSVAQRNLSIREAISVLAKEGAIEPEDAVLLDSLRRFRNEVVHKTITVNPGALQEWLATIHELSGRVLNK